MLTTFIQTIITRRLWVILLTLLLTALSLFYATRLRIVIDPAAILPQSHPFVASKALLENVFGEHYTLMVAIGSKSGNPADPAVLQKIRRINDALKQDSGLVKSTLLSIASQNAKAILDGSDGFEVRPFATVLNQPDKLLRWLDANPLYRNAIVSEDGRMYAVLAQFYPDPHGYGAILKRVQHLIDNVDVGNEKPSPEGEGWVRGNQNKEKSLFEPPHPSLLPEGEGTLLSMIGQKRDDNVNIYLSGHINFLGQIELYSERMIILVPIAIVLIALLLFDAFRSVQGLLLPLLTANLALIWVLGIMGATGIPLDVFNATTPILILAIAAGHAVQILKRYYEEYARLRADTDLTPEQANREAVIVSVSKVGRYMIAASLIAAMGFLSLTVFEIRTVKTFGVFTGLGIVCALLIELTFMPALRSWLKPPMLEPSQRTGGVWDAIIRYIVAGAATRRFALFWLLVVGLAIVGVGQVRIGNSNKANFADWTTVRQEDAVINQRFGGTQTFYIMIDTGHVDGIKNPAILNNIASLQRSLTQTPGVGKTVSIVDFLARMHQAMKGERSLPDTAELIGQYLLLYSMSGDPDDLKSYVDFNYQRANLKVFVRRDDSPFIMELVDRAQQLAAQTFPSGVTIQFGGGVAEAAALNEVMVRDKLLNIAQIIGVVFFASSLLFRSLLAGLLVLLPLVMAVIVNFGLLGWLGIPLNIPTSLISAMAVGIGADYAIYLISRYREEYRRDPIQALSVTLHSAGKACLYVAASVAVGYGVLVFSFGFKIHQWLALLIASAMTVSVFASLTLIPALLQRYRPAFLLRIPKGE